MPLTVAKSEPHRLEGWRNWCVYCGRLYWAEWQGHTGRVTRLELDELTPHKCKEERNGA